MTQEMEMLMARLDEECKNMAEDMILGKATDFGAYKYACGVARGYMLAKGYAIDIIDKLDRGNDE